MRRRTVQIAGVRLRKKDPVEGAGVAGTMQLARVQAELLRALSDAPEKGGFAAAGAALEDVDAPARLPEKMRKKRAVAGAGVGAEKIACFQSLIHTETSQHQVATAYAAARAVDNLRAGPYNFAEIHETGVRK